MRAFYDSSSKKYENPDIVRFFKEDIKIKAWLIVESELALAQAKLGIIPLEAAQNIKRNAIIENLDLAKMAEIKKEIGHGFVPFVKVLVEACDEEAGKYVHYGVTTQNIQQTGQLLILKNLTIVFKQVMGQILENLAKLAREHATSVMAGRTHGRHAIPITFGYKVAVWIYELRQAIERLEEAEKRIFTVMMGGAVGAFNTMPDQGREVQKLVAQALDMNEMEVPSRNIHSNKIEYISNLAQVVNVLHKIAEEVYYGGIEEFDEIQELFSKGTVGSSTMPHKINPKLAKGIITNASKLYSLLQPGFYSNVRLYEGDSSQYLMFDGLLDEAVELTNEVLIRAQALTKDLHVNVENLARNANLNQGLDNIEHIMMELAPIIGKDKAHSLMYDEAMKVKLEGYDLLTLLKQEPLLKDQDETYLKELIKPENYTGLSEPLALEQAEKAEAEAKRLLALQVQL